MLEVQERVAELESEIADDKFNDEMINDDVEKMIQMFLTVRSKTLEIKVFIYVVSVSQRDDGWMDKWRCNVLQ